jgi:effector-associated domain 1 (EAD1)-containing protein
LDARESELCRALLDAYTTRDDFEELLADIDKSLNSIVESSVNLRITVRRVVRIAKGEGWLGAVETAALGDKPDSPALKSWHQEYCAARPRAVPGISVPAWQLMDSTYFDLAKIRYLIREAMNAPVNQVIGFGVTDPEETFVKKLRHWLQGHVIGETELKDRLYLSPLVRSPGKWLEQVRAYRKDLDEVNVLFEVMVDSALSDDAIAAFWTGVCQDFRRASRRLVLVFVGTREDYPDGVTILPPPEFKRFDVALWAENLVRQRGWSLDLATIWTTWLCERAALDGQLDIRMLYGAMDKSVDHFRVLSPEEFRVKLESRMI